jgi:hypothetical protein
MSDNNHIPGTESTPQNPLESFIDHQRKAVDETAKAIEALLPEGFVRHGKEAGKEFVAGFRVLVDAAIGELEKVAKQTQTRKDDDDDDSTSTTGRSKVKVQVD